MIDNLILRDAKRKIAEFDQLGLHYNLVAKAVYCERQKCTDPKALFKRPFLRYVIAGLLSFDMGRMMGKEREKVYDFEDDYFAARLERKVGKIAAGLEPLMDLNLAGIKLGQHEQAIFEAYSELSRDGNDSLDMNGRHFHVGATKVLHFLNPELFIIVDSNAAKAFRKAHNVKFRKGTQPGYSSQRYIECMECAQKDILTYKRDHPEGFEALEPDTPITRTYDKLTFITGTYIGD